MIYPALVIDNRTFLKFGYIKVRSPVVNFGMNWDLKENYPKSGVNTQKIGETVTDYDIKAYLTSSLGGGRGYGMYALPQVGTKGFISFLGDRKDQAIWLGNLYEPLRDENNQIVGVNIPSDKDEDGENTDGSLDKASNIDGDEGTIIFRQKTTRIAGKGTSDEIDMQQLATENLLILDNNRVYINHYVKDDSLEILRKQSIQIDSSTSGEETVSLKVEDIENSINHTISVSSTGISINGNETAKLEIDSEGNITIFSDGGTITFDGAKVVELLGDANSLVKYADLKSIIDALADHIHMSPYGPTQGPLTSAKGPIGPSINSSITAMEADKVKTE